MNTAVIAMGSNIDAEKNIPAAQELLQTHGRILAVPSFVQTAPIGIADQPDFTNGAVLLETSLAQDDLTSALKQIEDQLNRDRTAPKFGPRTIDLDIVVWNNTVVDQDVYSRDFLRQAISEILPEITI